MRDDAERAGNHPALEALVQIVKVSANRAGAIDEVSGRIPGASAEDVARAPFALIGTHEEMATQLRTQAEQLGITSYVVRESVVPDLEPVLALLRG